MVSHAHKSHAHILVYAATPLLLTRLSSAFPPSTTTAEDEVEDGEAEDEEPKAKKHNTGAADLDKVTDFVEEQEMSVSGKSLEDVCGHFLCVVLSPTQ